MSLSEAIALYNPWWDARHYRTLCPESVQILLSEWFRQKSGCIINFSFDLTEVTEFMNQPYEEYKP